MNEAIFSNEETLFPFLNTIKSRLEDELESFYQQETRDLNGATLSSTSCKRKKKEYINKLEIVKRKSLYGFYEEEVLFVKVYCFNSAYVSKLSHLLTDRCIMGSVQCYESHITPVLQFLQDFNLQGMKHIRFNKIKIRRCCPNCLSSSNLDEYFWGTSNDSGVHHRHEDEHDNCPVSILQRSLANQAAHILDGITFEDLAYTQPTESYLKKGVPNVLNEKEAFDFEGPARQSVCILECDVHAENIIDPLSLSDNEVYDEILHMSSLKVLWREEKTRREKAGEKQDTFITPPFTDTCQHKTFLGDSQFQQRLDRLILKGQILNETILKSSNDSITEEFSQDDSTFSYDQLSQWVLAKDSAQNLFTKEQYMEEFRSSQVFT